MGAVRNAELDALRHAIDELAAERASAQARACLLEDLARSLAMIAAAHDPEHVVAALLHATREQLRFERAVYFERHADSLIARSALGFFSTPQPIALHDQFSAAPLADSRQHWIMTPLVHDNEISGFLYADRDNDCAAEQQLDLLKVLAAVSAAALRGSCHYQQVRDLALRDPLTGLLNRRAVEERLRNDLETCARNHTECAIAILDVDNLKRVNDMRGHAGGDDVLIRIATTLSIVARANDFAGRLAGDEFLIYFNDACGADARPRLRLLSRELRRNGLRCSIGAATYPRDATDVDGLIRAADEALYAVKAAGKNGFAFADGRNPRRAD
jgi:diguanylate cyclase (GGDEF)-like protein